MTNRDTRKILADSVDDYLYCEDDTCIANMKTTSSSTSFPAEGSHRPQKAQILVANEDFTFQNVQVEDLRITGAQVAEAIGARPVSEFVVLHHLKNGELETLRPTELVDVGGTEKSRFFVIRGSETYRFVVEGLHLEWPVQKILGRHIKLLAHIPEDEVLTLDREEGDLVIGDDDFVNLKPPGVEELKIRRGPRFVTVYYGEAPVKMERRCYSTEELLEAFQVTAGYLLDLISECGEFRELKPREKTCLKEGMKFSSHPPRGQSS